jgi:Sulfatase
MLQLQFVDRMTDRLIRRLKRIRLYNRALLVVTADHGASFRPGDLPRVVTRTNVAEVASVPLFVKAPRQRHGRVDDSPVESIDLLPTIARALRLRMPWKVEGRAVGELGPRRRPLAVLRERGEGGEVVVGRGTLARMRTAALRRNRSLLPGPSLFALAPRDWHPGRPLSVALDSPGRYATMNPRAHRVPVDVSGRLAGRARRPRPIAIAVNGRLVATAWTLVGSSEEYFTALVPPSSFRRGANSVRVVGLSRGT